MTKKWINLDKEIAKLQDEEKYIFVDLDIQEVNPIKIMALSREFDLSRLESLRESISKDGWKDISPLDIDLIQLLDGRYAVGNGGNHRAFVSNEFGIEKIKASVSTYIEISRLNDEDLEKLKFNRELKASLYTKIREKRRLQLNREAEVNEVYELEEKEKAWLKSLYFKIKNK